MTELNTAFEATPRTIWASPSSAEEDTSMTISVPRECPTRPYHRTISAPTESTSGPKKGSDAMLAMDESESRSPVSHFDGAKKGTTGTKAKRAEITARFAAAAP